MSNQDFLLTFSVDGTQAIRMMEQIGQRATALEARLNALGRGTGSGGGTTGGILNNLGLGGRQISGALSSIDLLQQKVTRLKSAREAGAFLGFNKGAGASAGALQSEAKATLLLGQAIGSTTAMGRQHIETAKQLAAQSRVVASQLDDTGQAFGRHARRVFEGILIYEAFGRAIQAVAAGVSLVVDIDRESRRLEAVLEISPTQGAQFIKDLGQIASDTVTPVEHLVSEADRMASAFLDIEDPVERAAAALELANAAGKFTTVTQRDLGTEVNNLIAIMKQLNIPVGDLDDLLGKIVTAGGNSSVVIADLADALQLSSRAIAVAGESLGPEKFEGFLDIVIALMSEFRVQTGRTGTEVGNTFRFLFARLTDPDTIKEIDKITGGILKMRDATGSIRDPISVMVDLNALLKSGALNATQFADVFDTLTLLNPQAKPDLILIAQLLDKIGPAVSELGRADSTALDDLVTKINDALGPQFEKLIIDAQNAFIGLFGPGILSAGFSLIALLRGIGDVLKALPPGVIQMVTLFGSLLVTWKLLAFAGKGLAGVFGIAGTSIATMGTAQAAAGLATAQAATTMGLFGKAMFGAKTLAIGLLTQLRLLAPLMAAFLIFDFAQQIGKQQDALREQVGGQLVGQGLEELKAMRENIISQLSDTGRDKLTLGEGFDQGPVGFLRSITDLKSFTTDPALLESLKEIDRLILKLGESGASVSLDDLGEGFKAAADATDEEKQAVEEINNLLTQLQDIAAGTAGSLANMTVEQKIAAQAATLLAASSEAVGKAISDLNDKYLKGKISQSEYSQGLEDIEAAHQNAAKLVATFGDALRQGIPALQAAKAGNEELTNALFDMLVQAGNLGPIQSQINALLLLGQTEFAVAQSIAAHPIVITTITRSVAIAAGSPYDPGVERFNYPIYQAQNTVSQFSSLFAALNKSILNVGSSNWASSNPTSGSSGSTTTVTQTPVLDIGELDASQTAKLIAIATALRNSIPGETAASKDSVVALIKDANFLQTVRGIDDRLLRTALEELTQQMEEANRLKQKEQILQNLVVTTGPLSSLISQPTTFGVGGTLASGTGLNFDPTKGNFTINVPIELSGLDPAKLQQLVYNIIYKAIADALRL